MIAEFEHARPFARISLIAFLCVFASSASCMNLFQMATRGIDLDKLPSESEGAKPKTPFDPKGMSERAGKRWLHVLTGDNYVALIDIKSMQLMKKKNITKAWTLWIYQEPKQLPNGKRYYSAAHLDYYDCDNRTTGTKQILFRNSQTQDTPSIHTIYFSDSDVEMTDSPPGSNGEYLLELVCD